MKYIFAITLLLLPILGFSQTLSIATNKWSPYINDENQPLGTAADILKQVLGQDGYVISWDYKNYDLAIDLVAKNKQFAAFPYFKTSEREARVLYSKPIFSVVSHVYYNRQREAKLDLSDLSQFNFGRVAGYSYGRVIDAYLPNAKIFPTEKEALESLFKNEIDFLPMTDSVMNTMLNIEYRDQALLIKKVANVAEKDTLHIIAPKTKEGENFIKKVDSLLLQVTNIKSLQPSPVARFQPKDIAKLVTAEGYPAIVGQTSLNDVSDYYTLPQGTRVLILKWSDKILLPSTTDRIYKSMIDLSHVVVLNGPHVGKELFIKNMHLAIL
jgi:polar amino acid transport system substrate-binding protein